MCGGGLLVRSRSHGRHREYFYACSSYHQRGNTVCRNHVEDLMKRVDEAVLGAFEKQLLGPGMVDEVIDLAVSRLAPAQATLQTDRVTVEQAIQSLDAEIENLTHAIALGGDLTSLVQGLKGREEERYRLRRRLAHHGVAEEHAALHPTRQHEEPT